MNKKSLIFISVFLLMSFTLIYYFFKNEISKKTKKPNVIFIAVDDLRPELNCYGSSNIVSPNIDELAKSSFLYENAVCNYPVCGASRASLLTGLRPNENRFKTYYSRMDEDADEFPSIPEWFKNNGYYSVCNGKISHFNNDSPESWSEPSWRNDNDWRDYQTTKNIKIATINNGHGPAYEFGENLNSNYADTKMIDKSINDIERLKSNSKPFFLAVGFIKPHLPFNAPKKYWDLYDSTNLKLANNRYKPIDAPNISMHNYAELRKYSNIPNGKQSIPDSIQHELIHGYSACVSYIDAELGRLINSLKKNKLFDDAVIVLWGDHGWQLGEHDLWAKHCNYQTSLKVPLLIKYPNQKNGKKINSIVELLDLYPTLCDLCSLPKPNHLQGKSLCKESSLKKENVGYSKYQKGETATTLNFSYTEWINTKPNEESNKMMYDLNNDPQENINIINNEYTIQKELAIKLDSVRNLN